MAAPQDLIDGVGEFLPGAALPLQYAATRRGEAIETTTALTRLPHTDQQISLSTSFTNNARGASAGWAQTAESATV